jgi:trk system potassium uptake protein TrkA
MSRKRFIVVGLGNFGASAAETLHDLGHEVAALDLNPDRVDAMGRAVTKAAVGDGTHGDTLRRMGAEDADAAIISTGSDITAAALTTLLLRELGMEELFMKVISREHAHLMEKIGVSETIFPERQTGIRLGRRISSHVVLNYVPLGSEFGLNFKRWPSPPPGWVDPSRI